jgi:hypothetical protein
MNNTVSNELLVNGLEIYIKNRFAEYDKLEEFIPSNAFEKRMKKIIKSQSNVYHKLTLTKVRKTVVVFAAVIVLMASALSVTAIREKILEFFITSESGVKVIEYDKKSDADYPKSIKKLYSLTYIPKGYKLEDKSSDDISSEYYYISGDKYIDFQQFTKDEYSSASDEDFSAPKNVKRNGQDYILRTADDTVLLVWEKNGYVFEMTGFEKLNEMYKIAESARAVREE